jgi:hypothetical protein
MKNQTIDKELLQYKTKDKDFDCVKMMRDIRTKIFNKYASNPNLLKKETEEAKKTFGF